MPPREAGEETTTGDSKLILTLRFLGVYWKIVFALTWGIILTVFLLSYNIPVPDSKKNLNA